MQQRNSIAEALAQARSRQSWNDRLACWEKPASESEEEMIQRAARTVRDLMSRSRWFVNEGVQIAPQGSYYNNTNVRKESDIDLRAVHPMIRVVYAENVVRATADVVLRYSPSRRTFNEVVAKMRSEMASEFTRQFGALNVETDGNKAIRVKGVPGSRAPIDVVPCFELHYVEWNAAVGRYLVTKGIAIYSRDGGVTFDFPEQHHDNGIKKRARTQLRFKRSVRMLKHLRDELVDVGIFKREDVPSYLVECLVYGIEDDYFLVEADERYDRLLRVVGRMHEQLNDPTWVNLAREINEVIFLFGSHQRWTADAAKRFLAAAWNRLLA